MKFKNYILFFFFTTTALIAQTKYDSSFEIGNGLQVSSGSYKVSDFKLQEDKRILVGGNFNTYNNVAVGNFMRLMQNGSIDATFNSGTGFNNAVTTIAIQPDGKIVVGGIFSSYNGVSRNKIIRLNYDGTVDNSFTIGTGITTGGVDKILIDTNGKILVTGTISNYNGVTTYNIIRLLPNGTLDTTFNPSGTGADGYILDAVIQPDNKIIIVGAFNSYNGVTKNRVARLNADGTLDTTFNTATNPGTTTGNVRAVDIQSTGKVIIGGYFTTYQDNPVSYLARLTTDGNYDSSFGFIGPNDSVQEIKVTQNNNIMVGGNFTTYDDNPNGRFIFLNANGSQLGSLSGGFFGTGFNQYVSALAFDEVTNNIYVGGGFSAYDGFSPVRGMCRLHFYETLAIPDSAFEQKLISLGIDTNGTTGDVLFNDITNITTLDVSESSISNLTGIQGFVKLQSLVAYNNTFSNIDLRYNTALDYLTVSGNNLTQIDTRNLPVLSDLDVDYNSLTTLNVSENLDLTDLRTNHNQLNSLDLTSNSSLEKVRATNNLFPELYFTANPNLTFINISNNPLLTILDVRNGANSIITSFDATNCGLVSCIYVDDSSASYLSGWSKDSSAHFVNNEAACSSLSVEDNVLVENMISIYPNPVNNTLFIHSQDIILDELTVYDILGKRVMEVTSFNESVNVSQLTKGIYYLSFQTNKGAVIKKLVKE